MIEPSFLEPIYLAERHDLLVQVVFAIAVGGLIGLERERLPERKFAGLRTMALLSGSAPIVVHLAERQDVPHLVSIYLGLAIALALLIGYIRYQMVGDDVGFTTSITVVLVALLGLLVGYGYFVEAGAISIIAVLILAQKDLLHRSVSKLSDQELLDSLKLGALVFVLYPLLPSEPIDPYGIVVLREVLVFALFVLGIQFASFVLMRQVGGTRGIAATGVLAGGANSFATAAVLARVARRSRAALDAASFALLLATVAMIVRNVSIAVVLAIAILGAIWLPAVVMIGVAICVALVLYHRGALNAEVEMDVDSPFSFRSAAKFSIAYVSILVAAAGGEAIAGETGLFATAFLGGLVSSAAVSVTAATVLSDGSVSVEAAAGMVILGIVASLTSKIALVEWINHEMRLKAGIPMALIAVAGVVTFAILY